MHSSMAVRCVQTPPSGLTSSCNGDNSGKSEMSSIGVPVSSSCVPAPRSRRLPARLQEYADTPAAAPATPPVKKSARANARRKTKTPKLTKQSCAPDSAAKQELVHARAIVRGSCSRLQPLRQPPTTGVTSGTHVRVLSKPRCYICTFLSFAAGTSRQGYPGPNLSADCLQNFMIILASVCSACMTGHKPCIRQISTGQDAISRRSPSDMCSLLRVVHIRYVHLCHVMLSLGHADASCAPDCDSGSEDEEDTLWTLAKSHVCLSTLASFLPNLCMVVVMSDTLDPLSACGHIPPCISPCHCTAGWCSSSRCAIIASTVGQLHAYPRPAGCGHAEREATQG